MRSANSRPLSVGFDATRKGTGVAQRKLVDKGHISQRLQLHHLREDGQNTSITPNNPGIPTPPTTNPSSSHEPPTKTPQAGAEQPDSSLSSSALLLLVRIRLSASIEPIAYPPSPSPTAHFSPPSPSPPHVRDCLVLLDNNQLWRR
jgi:hypothetical protein